MSGEAFAWLALIVSLVSLGTSITGFIVSEIALRKAKRP